MHGNGGRTVESGRFDGLGKSIQFVSTHPTANDILKWHSSACKVAMIGTRLYHADNFYYLRDLPARGTIAAA